MKLQTIVARELVAPSCPPPAHVGATSLVEFFARSSSTSARIVRCADRARALGLKMLSTPFSDGAVDLLERVGVDAYKIASGDLTWDRLIGQVRGHGQAARDLDRHGDARRSRSRR